MAVLLLNYYMLQQLANGRQQIYVDYGLKWEAILSQKGPGGKKLYSF